MRAPLDEGSEIISQAPFQGGAEDIDQEPLASGVRTSGVAICGADGGNRPKSECS